jgi:hypothetical protein
VYPDGVETEQASGYDVHTAQDFYGVLEQTAYDGGGDAPPPAFTDRVEGMFDYLVYVSDPGGCLPQNGDTDACASGATPGVADFFNRSDWKYVQSRGAKGALPAWAPAGGPSSMFPWAGQAVLRSGFHANATWAWFDVGPFGSSVHAHRDKLQVLLHARGAMLLADSGRFAYSGNDLSATLHTAYGRNTSAHNTLCVHTGPRAAGGSWCDQQDAPAVASAPVGNDTWEFTPASDWATGSQALWEGLGGAAAHTRSVLYTRGAFAVAPDGRYTDVGSGRDGDFLVVVDAITSDRPRHVSAAWHTHPNATAALNAASGVLTVGGASAATGRPLAAQACVVPAPGGGPVTPGWAAAALLRGQHANASTGVPWQGWYSAGYDDAWPAFTAEYRADVPGGKQPTYFAWLIVPTATDALHCGKSSITLLAVAPTHVTVSVTVASAGITNKQLTVRIAPPKAA